MRLLVISDLHLELGPFDLPSDIPDFDVAVFAGDISRPATSALTWIKMQREGLLKGRPAVFVPGNHEFYCVEIESALREGQLAAAQLGVHMLAPGEVRMGDVRFIGATLWTNYELLGDPVGAMRDARRQMNDHELISISIDGAPVRLEPKHALDLHRRDLEFIERHLAEPFEGATVVVTHHAPHPGSVQPKYRGDGLSPAFASDLTRVIERYQPVLWIHGHDHGSHDYWVGRTRILSNQAGYTKRGGGRENPSFDPRLVVEVALSR
ncbi:metallophosphoesterase [Bosea sp. LjRoot9]|uniref:metallophosphoesterase n=1 Tax=Bosea sp. LjRoot9 TaxID=3342341 RepID=UPI003ECCC86A